MYLCLVASVVKFHEILQHGNYMEIFTETLVGSLGRFDTRLIMLLVIICIIFWSLLDNCRPVFSPEIPGLGVFSPVISGLKKRPGSCDLEIAVSSCRFVVQLVSTGDKIFTDSASCGSRASCVVLGLWILSRIC